MFDGFVFVIVAARQSLSALNLEADIVVVADAFNENPLLRKIQNMARLLEKNRRENIELGAI